MGFENCSDQENLHHRLHSTKDDEHDEDKHERREKYTYD